MNPEEGSLRPQIQDRFGLRVLVRGVQEAAERLEIYRRSTAYQRKPYKFVLDWAAETEAAALDIVEARKRLTKVVFAKGVQEEGLRWIEALKIDSHRAEMTLFEAGRAYAAVDNRLEVTLDDLRAVASMALRQRQTDFATRYFTDQQEEDEEIQKAIHKRRARKSRAKKVSPAKQIITSDNSRGVASEAKTKPRRQAKEKGP
jgi:magnesium chelatase subunit I